MQYREELERDKEEVHEKKDPERKTVRSTLGLS